MKALLAVCIAGAITFTGVIYLVGGSTPGTTVPDAKPVAMPEAAASFEPSVPGHFPMPGFPGDRISFWHPSSDGGAEKAGGPALAAVAPEETAGPATGAGSGSVPAAVSSPSLTVAQPEPSSGPGTEPGQVPPAVSAPTLLAKAVVGDDPVEVKPLDSGHRDAAHLVPTNCDASIDASRTAPATQDFRYLVCYVWSELPPAEKPAATVLRSLKDIPVGTPLEEIKRASDAFGLDFNFMKAVAKIESGFDPKQRTGSYIGLFQLSKYEFGKFGSGDILNPRDNAVAAAYKIITEGILFAWVTRRTPDLNDLYLIHQQGWEGAAEHLSQPDRIAWKSMCATGEGREKGEKWCRRAIWGNTLPAVKAAWKSVDKLTSEAVVGLWRERVAHFQSKYMGTATADAQRKN
jgi:hypothetical protein